MGSFKMGHSHQEDIRGEHCPSSACGTDGLADIGELSLKWKITF